jgi:hypothetical protein
MSILLLVAPLVAPHNTITIGENRKEQTKRWLTGEESRKDHNRSTSTSTALPRTVQTLCNIQSVNKTKIGKVMDHRDQGRFEGEQNKEGEQCRCRKKEDKNKGLVEFRLLIEIEPTHDLGSVYPVGS